MTNRFRLLAAIASALSIVTPGAARAESVDRATPVAIKGERLPPEAFGPSVIESMDEVIARDALRAPEPPVKKRDDFGLWTVPSIRATYFPNSGHHNLVNKNGDTHMGIGFARPVRLDRVFVAGQGAPEVWTPALRVVGYRDGKQVGETAWYHDISDRPTALDVNLDNVDRVVFESIATVAGGGFYALDDLTFTYRDTGESVTLDFEELPYGQVLTGTGYADLTWEVGEGVTADCGDAIAAPQTFAQPQAAQPAENDDGLWLLRAGTQPLLTLNFQGVKRGDAGQFSYPPDTCGAVGPTQFVICVNRNIAIYNKATGAQQSNVSITSFLPGSSGDPRVLFDHYTNRWVVLNDDFNSRLYLAISLTSNASGSWFKTNFLVTGGSDGSCWPDYPTLGLDANGIYTGAYMVGCQMSLFCVDKAPMVAPSPTLGTVTAFRGLPWEGALQPTMTYGNPPGEYVVSTNSNNGIRVRRVDPPLTDPTLVEVGIVPVSSWGDASDAPALGGPALDTVDSRLMNAVYRNGSIWTAHTVSGGAGATCRWYQLAEGSPFTVAQWGAVGDATRWHYFPSIAVNEQGDAVLGCSGSKASEHAGCYYAGRLVNDPPGQMSAPALLKAGIGPQNNIDGFGRNRWGDYSLTTLDPSDSRTIWTVQEYADVSNIWGTWVGKLQFEDVDAVQPAPQPGFEIAPTAISSSAITMRSTEAIDADSPPVQYQFDYVSGAGGHDSFWQFDRDYVDTALPANSAFTYRVRARDNAAPNPNITPYSPSVATATAIQTPAGVNVSSVTADSATVTATGTFTNVGFLQSGFFFEVTPDPGPGSGAAQWGGSATRSLSLLSPCTQYVVRARARNFQGDETPFSEPVLFATPGCVCNLPGDVNGDESVDGLDVAAFLRVKLGTPLETDLPHCADFGGPDLESDAAAFSNALLSQ